MHCDKITADHLRTLERDGVVHIQGVLDQKWIEYLRGITGELCVHVCYVCVRENGSVCEIEVWRERVRVRECLMFCVRNIRERRCGCR